MTERDTSRRRRSDATRTCILNAARERFASDGYDRATIRGIAADAGIDPALVMRHFGSKADLFTAAVDFDLHMPDLSALPRGDVGAAFVRHFLKRWEQDEILKALLRTAATHEAAAELTRTIFATQIVPVIRALGDDPDSALTRAGLVSSQILGFALCRYVLQIPPVAGMGPDEVVRWLGPTVQRYILGEAPPA